MAMLHRERWRGLDLREADAVDAKMDHGSPCGDRMAFVVEQCGCPVCGDHVPCTEVDLDTCPTLFPRTIGPHNVSGHFLRAGTVGGLPVSLATEVALVVGVWRGEKCLVLVADALPLE